MHRSHKDKIHDLRYIDASVEHIDGYSDTRLIFFLEFADQAVTVWSVMHALHAGIDDLEHSNILRKQLFEHFAQTISVIFGHCKYDRLARSGATRVLYANVYHFFPLASDRILVAHQHFKIGAGVVERVRINTLFDQGVSILLG